MQRAALIGTPDGPGRRFDAAIDAAFDGIGLPAAPTGVGVTVHQVERGGWLEAPVDAATAHALAARLAAAVGRPVRFLAVTQPVDHLLEVELADRLIGPDGTAGALVPSVAAALVERHGADWGEICDAKPYLLVESVLDVARDAWGIRAVASRVLTRGLPASTGDARLDRLVAGIRLAGRGAVVVVGGVTCVEHRLPDGMIVTTPIDAEGLERIRAAVPGMVG